MKAFTDTPITKERFLFHLREHQRQDAFISGSYGETREKQFKGCAVGCSLRSVELELKKGETYFGNHKKYEEYLGVPEWLARLEDAIFEGVSKSRQKIWPVEFGEAINEGSDLEKIKIPFVVFILNQNLEALNSLIIDEKFTDVVGAIEQTKKATTQMIEAQKSGNQEKISAAWSAVWSAAESAARSAESAAWSAARSAARSAESAAWSAARSAESAAWSTAESAARSAESAARSAAVCC